MLVAMSSRSPAERHARPWMVAIIVALALVVGWPALDNELVHDDVPIVRNDPRVAESGRLAEIWTSDYWPGERPSYNYRPLTTTSFALTARAGLSQRVVNSALHALCSGLVFGLLLACRLPGPAALVGGALFAVHPLHSEVLFTLVGRSELLAAAAGLAYLIASLRGARVWPALLLAVALASKESAIVLPALALLLRPLSEPGEDLRSFRRFAGRVAVLAALPVGLFFLARLAVFGTLFAAGGHVSAVYNPLVALSAPGRWLNASWLLLRYLGECFLPIHLQADHSLGELDLIEGLFDPRWILLLLLFGVGCVLLVRRRTSRFTPEALGLAVVVVALLPVSNLLVTTGVGFAERLAYLPSVGACLVMASLWQRLVDRAGSRRGAVRLLRGLPVVLVLVGAVVTIQRDRDWQDAESFTLALVRDAPGGALAHGLRAVHLQESGRTEDAAAHLQRAVDIAPHWADAWASLAELRFRRRDFVGAAECWGQAGESAALSKTEAAEAAIFHYRAAGAWLAMGDCGRARAAAGRALQQSSRPISPQLQALERRLAAGPCAPGEPADAPQARN